MKRLALALFLVPPLAWADPTTLDLNSAPFQDMVPVTSGTAFTLPNAPGRSVGFVCTTAATLQLTMALSNRVVAVPVAASPAYQQLPFSVSQITVSSGTCPNLWNLP